MSQSAALLQTSDAPRIRNVQFGLLNPDTVRRQSVVPITNVVLYTRQLPTAGGLNDLRMGTCDRRLHCGTCRHDMMKCPGHFGHLDLAAPMYHVSMLPIVLKMLRCVCIFCSSLLVEIDEDDARLSGVHDRDRLELVVGLCKSRRRCPRCEAPVPKYVHTRATTSIAVNTSDIKFESEEEEAAMNRPFTAGRAREILSGISDEHVRILGGSPHNSHPAWMILTVLQIPPPISRPCITASDGSRTKGQDDVTVKLTEIFKANKAADTALRDAGCASGFMPDVDNRPYAVQDLSGLEPDQAAAIQVATDNLQQHLVQYFHRGKGTDSKMMSTGGRAHSRTLRLIPDRWKGKKGRFRGNLAGKRVDFSSRTVASPAPDYDVDEVGIPEVVAYHLTFPERVTAFNLDQLTQCVRLGCGVKGGAATVVIPGSQPIDLSLCTNRDSIVLEVGWVVDRHLVDGDWVLLNRQPSLHRMSIMAHRIRIIKDKTFRLPVCDTTPYNADFDGDELNIHVLQTHDARAEAEMLMSVSTQMINPENNKPIIALVQDSLVAAFLMTQRTTFLRRHQAMQVLMTLRYLPRGHWLPPPAVMKPEALWTGKQLFSLLFPKNLTFDMVVRSGSDAGVGKPGGWMDPLERRVRVVDSELVCGSLCKKTLGTSAGGLVHVLIQDWGFKRAGQFVSDAQRLLQAYMMIRGFSVGIGDCIMGEATHERVNALMADTFAATDQIRKEAVSAPQNLVDGCITKMLGGFLTSGGAEVVKDVNVCSGNRISVMIESGAKGSAINISQILSSVGQQSVEGGRIQDGIDGRTLPCYRRGDTSAGAHGFVCNSYGTGLTAQEYFFHAMGGREGLVDTAVKTASTGYIQRRLSKAQEGLQVRYDSTVRNTSGGIIQFYYGGDSYYPTKLERTRYPCFDMDNAALFAHVVGDLQGEWKAAALQELEAIQADRDLVRASQLRLSPDADGGMVMPTNPTRIFSRAQSRFGKAPPPSVDALLAPVKELLQRVRSARRPAATVFTCAYLRAHLTLRNLLVHQLGEEAVQWVCTTLWLKYSEALAEPGEMVGTLGASSIGAPCTQMVGTCDFYSYRPALTV
jgi:DNA-directed RNA polymerase II subunit RPB1